ncbi:zinc-finger domain-containing protein [Gammaproteobacteria bacterium]|nr:zinc-finger domain-containing protein [Gammaproteobacteria bacterium]
MSDQKHVSYNVVDESELPFHCPPKNATSWNMHPKVFVPFDEEGMASCPYCGARYRLKK